MKRGIVHTAIYYVICIVLFIALTFLMEEPRHAPGLNYIFLFLILFVAFGLLFINLLNIAIKKNKQDYYLGSLIIHLSFILGISIWFFMANNF